MLGLLQYLLMLLADSPLTRREPEDYCNSVAIDSYEHPLATLALIIMGVFDNRSIGHDLHAYLSCMWSPHAHARAHVISMYVCGHVSFTQAIGFRGVWKERCVF